MYVVNHAACVHRESIFVYEMTNSKPEITTDYSKRFQNFFPESKWEYKFRYMSVNEKKKKTRDKVN